MSDPLFSDVDPRPAGDGRDDAPPRYETANREQIELQHHGSQLWFKNIYIKELPAEEK